MTQSIKTKPAAGSLAEQAHAHLQWEMSKHRLPMLSFVELLPTQPAKTQEQQGMSQSLEELAKLAAECRACPLHKGRTKSVFARGDDKADLLFVGEGPGYYEDQQGLPFVGKAGQLLDRMINAMRYEPKQVYICNVVKCRPPENRTPLPDESAACLHFLEAQIRAVQPKAIVALGRCAAQALGAVPESGSGWRGRWSQWQGIDMIATYHPAYLLRNPEHKRIVWQDLQQVMTRLGK
ncbi:MAG: uracil-DNA glycosylase [Myxococcales bacterium]|nr:MAG: uracil-DNA glycosylase [Myxococcales bacterium]